MEKEKRIKNNIQIGVLVSIFSAFLVFMSWIELSEMTKNEFLWVCEGNNYNNCMRWFWETRDFFGITRIISVLTLVASLAFVVVNKKRRIL